MARDLAPVLPSKIGKHDVVGFIATGGMAELFLGKDPTTHQPVVIKRILPHLARQTSFVSMFIDEARIGSMIHHPNLVEHLELGQVGTELFLVMEYLEGENLSGLMRRLHSRKERLDFGLAAYVIAQACLGLHAAHSLTDDHDKPLHIVHRDVSPSNILITYEGEVKVLDFGIATAAHRLTHTATGQIKGKFSYMSPEQCRGEDLDARSDIFSLGVVLYELSTQKRLFKRANELLVLKALCDDPIPRPSKERDAYPSMLEDICLRALARDRDRRIASAKTMHGELVAAMTALGVGADPQASLKYEMRRLFSERITKKHEVVSQVRSGTDVGALPPIEVDENIEMPDVTAAPATPSSIRAMSEAPTTARARRPTRLWLAAAGVAVVAVLVSAWWLVMHDSAEPTSGVAFATTSIAAAAAVPSAPTKQPLPPTEPVPRSYELTVESTPPGDVFVDGKLVGTSPVRMRLPQTRVHIEVRKAGYVTMAQDLALVSDQRLVLALRHHAAPAAKPKPPDAFHRFD